jgi:signal transduction histidine kinase
VIAEDQRPPEPLTPVGARTATPLPRRPRTSIRGKLVALTLAVILIPVFSVAAIVAVREIRDIRTQIVEANALMGEMVAEFGAAALAFQDRTAAEQTLRALGNHDEFVDAALYDSEGKLVASFARPGHSDAPPSPSLDPGARPRAQVEGDRITAVRPVEYRGVRYGTLVLHTSTAPLTSRVRAYLWGLLLLTIGVVAASLMLAWALERMVSKRLLRLAEVARHIAQKEDYTVRADAQGGDEIGLLGQAFNRMLAEIGRRQQQAQQAVRTRDEFLSVASHELKTPLTSLKLQVQGLLATPPAVVDKNEARRLASSMALTERQIRRLERLINNLLDVSRIAVGRFTMEVEDVDLSALVRDVASQFTAELERVGCRLTLDLPDDVMGRWDALRLEQVVVNLISNAIKYGDGKPIDLSLAVDDGHALIRVRDHGIGIAPDDQKRIFGRFERAVSVNYGGLGLGLYITRQIVMAHGGTIRVESTLGEGSTFVVEVPRRGPPWQKGGGS